MPQVILHRTTFETSRASEYFNLKELQASTGQSAERFAAVALKELMDNALDAAEMADVAPCLDIAVLTDEHQRLTIVVQDNGQGIPAATVETILHFESRTSDKAMYRTPTRGAQGNALKTVIGLPSAFGRRAPIIIEAQGVHHRILAWMDPSGEVRTDYRPVPMPQRQGTRISLELPGAGQRLAPETWARAFALFNPHASVKIRWFSLDSEHGESDDGSFRNSYHSHASVMPERWHKWLPTDTPSAWWFSGNDLKRLIFSHINETEKHGKNNPLLRDFVRQFRNLSSTVKAKAVCSRFPSITRLTDFKTCEADVARLLSVMQAEGEPPSPDVLGYVGEESFRARFEAWYGVNRFWYKRVKDEINRIPFVIEAAVAETVHPGEVWTGINFSPTFSDPLADTWFDVEKVGGHGWRGFLSNAHVIPGERGATHRTAAAIHLVCPSLTFLDRGKTRLQVPWGMVAPMAKGLWSVAKDLYQEYEQRLHHAEAAERAARARERQAEHTARAQQWSLAEAVFEVMLQGVAHASGNGASPYSQRFLYYPVRKLIQQYTDKELTQDYFAQLLTAYQREHGPLRGLYYDPRGVLYEPHTRKAIPIGTREVESYTFPAWLYDKILYVEKKGVWPIFEAAHLAERYDMAIMAAEGYATEAARVLFEKADQDRQYQLFVLHDADPDGYNIARTLREATDRMPDYAVDVIDLGLSFEDALRRGLATEEFIRKKALPEDLILTDVERRYFTGEERRASEHGKRTWTCERVELNAFTAPNLMAFIEERLQAVGVRGKLIPPDEIIGRHARTVYDREIDDLVDRVLHELVPLHQIKRAIAVQFRDRIPWDETRAWIEEGLEETKAAAWYQVLDRKVPTVVENITDEVTAEIRTQLQATIRQP
jgi:Histidine kinase-, DNA gyrase B-, and HSP90-like ATPase